MPVNRLWTIPVALLAAAIVVLAPAAARDRKPPRIVAAAMVDSNRNLRADRVRLTYSEPIRHAADRDGHYATVVTGYRIRSLGVAHGRTLLVFLVEKKAPDGKSRPAIRYRRTTSKPVRDRAGNQAVAQLFRRVRAHGHLPSADAGVSPSPTQPRPAASSPVDADHDGTPDAQDCTPNDPSIHPGAPDLPDLKFVDSNCDGIDGNAARSIFVSTDGKDTNPGTREKPKRSVATAVVAARRSDSAVLVAAGTYAEGGGVELVDDVGIYGGYASSSWSRSNSNATVITGSPQAVFADGVRGVTLQLLSLRSGTAGQPAGASSYAVRAIGGSKITIEHSTLQAGDGLGGLSGLGGRAGDNGAVGAAGQEGNADAPSLALGGAGGASSIGAAGGSGGEGQYGGIPPAGFPGASGAGPVGGAGGAGGENGDPAEDGRPGTPGGDGVRVGVPGVPGTRGLELATTVWRGHDGTAGTAGEGGSGGGGGGGGGGQDCFLCVFGSGSGGGGGGAGGGAGTGGGGGKAGGGSFGIYLRDSEVHLSSGTTVKVGDGGAGGAGGQAGIGGFPGLGGQGGPIVGGDGEVGRGGNGGRGGFGTHGGAGGGGAGGPSIGVFKVGTSKADVGSEVSIRAGAGGRGGNGGAPGLDGQGGYFADVASAA